METKINIAEILKDKPKGTKLYTDAFGELSIEDIFTEDELGINLSTNDGDDLYFYNDGKYNVHGEPILSPSKDMEDWSKFSWKKGNVLVSKGDKILRTIFEGFEDDTYTTFKGKHFLCDYGDNEEYNEEEYNNYKKEVSLRTIEFEKDNEDDAQTYINTIEEKLGGKLNMETLEIENAQPEFKDGDIVYADYGHKQAVFIVSGKTDLSEGYNSLIALDLRGLTLDMGYMSFFKEDLCKLRFATEEEKRQLFDALAKEGKAWDAEKKQIVDLKPKCEFKPFDKVLGRNEKDDEWEAELFSHYKEESQYPFRCIGFSRKYCIPYNEETAHLLGTTDEWKGGEG